MSNKKYKIGLIKKSFYKEDETKIKLAQFIKGADIFSMNKQCLRFEKKFAKKQKRKHAIFYNSGSSANLVLIQALINMGVLIAGDKVGFSSLTWATNVMPLIELGLSPIAIDCNPKTLNISVEEIKKVGNIKCLFITNTLGFCDNLTDIEKYCRKNNILLLEDNCESLGSIYDNKLLGNFGFASTFSFFVGHHMSTIEGGMVCTDNDKLANMLKMTRSHGWDRNLGDKEKFKLRKKHKINDFYYPYTFYELGYNLRPNEINGLLGNIQINYLDEIIKKRFDNFKYWNSIAKNNKYLLEMDFSHMSIISNFAFPLIFKSNNKFLEYKNKFQKAGIEIRPIIAGNITRQPFYKKYSNGDKKELKNSDFVHKNGFYFGNNPDLNEKEVAYLGSLLK